MKEEKEYNTFITGLLVYKFILYNISRILQHQERNHKYPIILLLE